VGTVTPVWLTWREAADRALYGPGGFYRREQPSAHFRTSVHIRSGHASPLFARAVLALARTAGVSGLLDLGAGGGELLTALHGLDPALALAGVDVRPRPPGLPDAVTWHVENPHPFQADFCRSRQFAAVPGRFLPFQATSSHPWLLVANEWLDDIPVDVAELDAAGVARLVLVDPADGAERLGDRVAGADAAWLARWWPLAGAPPGARAEIGHPRDDAWAGAVRGLVGLAVAVDYAHVAGARPPYGTLAGFRGGRQVPPVPDGSCDVTAHVAVDAVAAAGEGAGATGTVLTTQRAALGALGVRGVRPPHEDARADPAGYLAALAAAGEAAELRAAGGLGGFAWLVQGVGVRVPDPIAALTTETPAAASN
jgi:hypothetical protein